MITFTSARPRFVFVWFESTGLHNLSLRSISSFCCDSQHQFAVSRNFVGALYRILLATTALPPDGFKGSVCIEFTAISHSMRPLPLEIDLSRNLSFFFEGDDTHFVASDRQWTPSQVWWARKQFLPVEYVLNSRSLASITESRSSLDPLHNRQYRHAL